MKFTPGPWDHDESCEVRSTIGALIAATDDNSFLIATQLANARLIAAAPEMYSLIKELLDTRGSHFIDNDVSLEWDQRACAALKKVEE